MTGLRLLFALAASGLLAGCAAPPAELIEGEIARDLRGGMASGKESFDHGLWGSIVKEHAVDEGRKFDYVALVRESSDDLDAYLERLRGARLSSLSGNELLALFVNAYNAYTVHTIRQEVSQEGVYRIESIRDIPDVFDRKVHAVGGYELSLNNIEHNILRPFFRDPRIHFAVNCASISCPPLPTEAFRGESVDAQLEAAARRVLGSPDYVRVEQNQLVLTRILAWYRTDFVAEGYRDAAESLPDYVRKFTREEVREWIDTQPSTPPVRFMEYDWGLNHPK